MVCSKEEIEEFCHALPRYKRPKEIIFADIPRNATGKIENQSFVRFTVPIILLQKKIRYKNIQVI